MPIIDSYRPICHNVISINRLYAGSRRGAMTSIKITNRRGYRGYMCPDQNLMIWYTPTQQRWECLPYNGYAPDQDQLSDWDWSDCSGEPITNMPYMTTWGVYIDQALMDQYRSEAISPAQYMRTGIIWHSNQRMIKVSGDNVYISKTKRSSAWECRKWIIVNDSTFNNWARKMAILKSDITIGEENMKQYTIQFKKSVAWFSGLVGGKMQTFRLAPDGSDMIIFADQSMMHIPLSFKLELIKILDAAIDI